MVPDSPRRCSSADHSDDNSFAHANARKPISSVPNPDRVMLELQRCEPALHAWLGESPANADLLVHDPAGALRAANLGMDEAVLQELETTMKMIALKIGAVCSSNCA
jgi:hypothetical protein